MVRKSLVAGNWKMNGTRQSSAELVSLIREAAPFRCDTVVFPPAIYIEHVSGLLNSTSVLIGAQNVNSNDHGAHTGEISPTMIKELGCSYCLVGHSERRMVYGESSKNIAAKFGALITHQITPILCIGETIEQRKAGQTEQVVEDQLSAILEAFVPGDLSLAVIAYEPIWAIGTGETASPSVAGEVHGFIREMIRERDYDLAEGMRILYGGSVNPDNAAALMAETDIDGALVGGASLKASDFIEICNVTGRN